MVGDLIKKHRVLKELTQKELADLLDVSPSTVGMYEQNRRIPDAEILVKISNIFNVTVDYLLGKADSPKLTAKNERDIAKKIEELQQDLESQVSLMFDGEEMDDQTRELLLASLAQVVISSKMRAKEKFTPKKYQK